ncbi:MAG: hypothetical protein PHP52_08610 [Bacteroidales bacterium]|jgi:hypothetical protein|nr:hypothetical protein [Bacteroidales bacterium]MDD4216895.1 hypothetical protein [Bacteroidales bacterium]MDY0140581.1 hypothetical protein [Bacteroidales bacterium]
MAKIFLFFLIIAFGLFSCKSNKTDEINESKKETIDTNIADAKKMIDKIQQYTKVVTQATEDKKLNDIEIKQIEKLSQEFDALEKEINEKYSDDIEGKAIMEKYMEDNKAELEKIYEEFFIAMMMLYECEGAEKLE